MENTMFENRVNLTELAASVSRIREEVGKIIVGQHKMVDLLIAAILADGHVLIEGVPGVAKTLTAKLIAKTISVNYSRIQFTPDLMPSDVLGTSVYNLKTSEFNFKKGPIFSNIVLIDEINRAPAKTQSALFEVMEERQITMDGTAYIMERPFMILATQNPVDQEGTYRLPEAQLDRFIFKIEVEYPNPEEELAIISGFHSRKGVNDISSIQPILSAQQIDTYRQNVKSLHIEPGLMKYISQIVTATRNNNALYLGASPRASLAIMTASKAMAAMRGRDFVTPEDIQEVVSPVLNHRIMLTPEKEMEGVSAKDIIQQIIKNIEVPR
jgi:MoxR-like ATPase